MKMRLITAAKLVLACLLMAGCEPDDQYHARSMGSQLRVLYAEWERQGFPKDFNITNNFYIGHTTNQVFFFTNQIVLQGTNYKCQLAVRSPERFRPPGLLVVTDRGVLLWVGDNGQTVVSPEINGLP